MESVADLVARHGYWLVALAIGLERMGIPVPGEFIAVLRALAAVLAGINHMPWRRFLVFNAAGAVVWVGVYGMLAYVFGDKIEELSKPAGVVITLCAVVATVFIVRFVRHQEKDLEGHGNRVPASRSSR